MQRIKNSHLANQAITAILLSSIVFAASGAEQMMRAATAVVSPVKPPSPNTTMIQNKLVPPTPGGGVMQLSPAAACGMNSTPRISSINGRSSGGIVFKPGDTLNIAGCGFGKSGQVALIGVGPLFIDGWGDANIHAHIDPALSRVRNIASGVKLYVKPNGAKEMVSQVTHSFKAVYIDTTIGLETPELGIFSNIYGATKAIFTGTATKVVRNLVRNGVCPPVNNQTSEMSDFFNVEINDESMRGIPSIPSASSGPGLFELKGVNYTNETNQDSWNTPNLQMGLVGNGGNASKVPGGAVVTFQGHTSVSGGKATCTSSYTISLLVSGPRGFKPWAKAIPVSGHVGAVRAVTTK